MIAWRAAARIFASSSAENPVVPMTWTMRACAASAAKRDRNGGRGEIDQRVGMGDQRQRIVAQRHAGGRKPGQRAGIGAEIGMARRLERAGQHADRRSPAMARIRRRPMRPAAPAMTMRIALMRLSPGAPAPMRQAWVSIVAPGLPPSAFLARDRHHGGAQQPLADHVAGLHHIHDGARRLAVARHFGDGLMQIGVEFRVRGVDRS